mgnify:CR=1 FL=1
MKKTNLIVWFFSLFIKHLDQKFTVSKYGKIFKDTLMIWPLGFEP